MSETFSLSTCCIVVGAILAAVALYYFFRKKTTEKFGGVDIETPYQKPLEYKRCMLSGPTLVLLWNSKHGDQPDPQFGWNTITSELNKQGIKTLVLDHFDNVIYPCDGVAEIESIQSFLGREVEYPEIRFYRNGYTSRSMSKMYHGPFDVDSIVNFTLKQI